MENGPKIVTEISRLAGLTLRSCSSGNVEILTLESRSTFCANYWELSQFAMMSAIDTQSRCR